MDGVRAVACLIVVLVHTFGFCFGNFEASYGPVGVGTAKIGVWLFFVLSAFLLSMQFLKVRSLGRFLPRYVVGRILRILPPFMIAVVVYRYIGTAGINDWQTMWQVVTFRAAIAHFWTIAPEFTFYFLLPLILLPALAIFDRFGWLASAIFMGTIAGGATWLWPPVYSLHHQLWVGGYFICFTPGVAAAIILTRLPHISERAARFITRTIIVILVAYVVVMQFNIFGDAARGLLTKHYLFGPAFAIMLYTISIFPPLILTEAPMRAIGRWSFSIYLYHWGVVNLLVLVLPDWLAFPVSLVLSIFFGWLGYIFIERPTYGLRHLIFEGASRYRPNMAPKKHQANPAS